MNQAVIGGPMAESSNSENWKSVHNKSGQHYNIYGSNPSDTTVDALKTIWETPDDVDELNFCLFGTSGIHGSYGSVALLRWSFEKFGILTCSIDDTPDDYVDTITFLVVHSRTVCMRYGNVRIRSEEDLKYLEGLRDASADAVKEFLK